MIKSTNSEGLRKRCKELAAQCCRPQLVLPPWQACQIRDDTNHVKVRWAMGISARFDQSNDIVSNRPDPAVFPGSPHLPLSHFSKLPSLSFCSLFYSSAAFTKLAFKAEEAGMHPCQPSNLVDLCFFFILNVNVVNKAPTLPRCIHSRLMNAGRGSFSSVRKMMFSEQSYRCSIYGSEQVCLMPGDYILIGFNSNTSTVIPGNLLL